MSDIRALAAHWRPTVLTLLVSLAGGAIAQLFALPAAPLIGGAIVVSIASLTGMKTAVDTRLRNVAFVIVGMALGTNVASDTLSLVGRWPITLLGLAIVLVIIVATSGLILNRFFGVDRGSAYLSSFPGHLSFVLSIAEAGYGNSGQIAIIQTIRVLLLTVLVPVVARFVSADTHLILPSGTWMDPLTLVLLAVACAAGGFVFLKLKIPAAFVLGSMLVAVTAKLAGLYTGNLPFPLVYFGYVTMGGLIGSRFNNVTMRQLSRAALGGTVVTFVSIVTVTGAATVLSPLAGMPFGQIWIGLAPGALETMGALGLALGYDTAFITGHHTARFFYLSLAVPLVARLVGRVPEPTR